MMAATIRILKVMGSMVVLPKPYPAEGLIQRTLFTRKKYFRRLQLGPLAIGPFTQGRQLCIECSGFLSISRKFGCFCRAVQPIESIGRNEERGFEFLQCLLRLA